MIKRIISCIVSTVIVLGATIAYDRTPACRIAVMEQVPTQLASVLPRAASYELELRTEEGNRSYTVNCHDKDGSTFRSYTMQTVEGEEEPLNFTYTDYTYDENGNCTDAVTTDKTNNSTSEYRRSYDDKNRVLRTENYEDGELSVSSETVYTEVDNGQSSAVNTVYDADGNELMVVRMGMNTNGDVLSSRTYEGEDNITSSTDNRYDNQGRLIQSVTVDESGVVLEVLTVYSVDGKTQTTRSTIEGGTLSTDTRTFDDNGNLVSMHQTDSDGYASETCRGTLIRSENHPFGWFFLFSDILLSAIHRPFLPICRFSAKLLQNSCLDIAFSRSNGYNRYMRIKTVSTEHSYREIDRRCAMRIIIVGCGKVGSELAGQLSAAGHDLTLIDLSERRLNELSNMYDLATVKGSGTSYHVLREAGVQDTDLLIAVTTHDEINLLSCLIARKASGCHAIARVRDPEYVSDLGFIRDELGISMVINPELSTARVVSRLIRFPSAIRVSTFARGRIELLDLKIPHESRLDGMAVCEVNPLLRTDVLLCMVRRDGQTYIPKGDFILRENDNITVIIPPHEQNEFFEKVGLPVKRISSAMLVGGGKISYFLAKILLDSGISVKIIENKLERCEALSEMLPHATIIYGDGTDRNLLDEEGLATCEAFAALTGMDEENILLALHAGRHSRAKLFTKVNRVNFEEVIASMPIGKVIRPKQTTAELISQYTRAMQNSMGSNVETLHQLDGAEALEFRVAAHHLTGVPLQDMPIRPDVLLCCINRRGKRIIPRGHDVLHEGDTVIVVSTFEGMNDLQDIFLSTAGGREK